MLDTTLSNWCGPVALDLAAAYPRAAGGLRCFEAARYDPRICPDASGFGVYKTQRGFDGFVPAHLLDVRRMYPCLTIWQRM